MIDRESFPPASNRAEKIRGVHLAVVVENKDEGQPYRVKVKYPWLPGEEKTYWARIAVPMAGPGRGTYFLPEKNDQVLVVFEHGDVERPIVIGCLWSETDPPPEANADGKNDVKVIKSKSGHRIIFDDSSGKEKVIVVDSTKKNKVSMDVAAKTTSIECSGDVTIKAQGNIIIQGKAVKVTAKTGAIKAEGAKLAATSLGALSMKGASELKMGSKVSVNMGGAPVPVQPVVAVVEAMTGAAAGTQVKPGGGS